MDTGLSWIISPLDQMSKNCLQSPSQSCGPKRALVPRRVVAASCFVYIHCDQAGLEVLDPKTTAQAVSLLNGFQLAGIVTLPLTAMDTRCSQISSSTSNSSNNTGVTGIRNISTSHFSITISATNHARPSTSERDMPFCLGLSPHVLSQDSRGRLVVHT